MFLMLNLLLDIVKGIVKRVFIKVELDGLFFLVFFIFLSPVLVLIDEFNSYFDADSLLANQRQINVIGLLKSTLFVLSLYHYLMRTSVLMITL